jgi:hypothetical protein
MGEGAHRGQGLLFGHSLFQGEWQNATSPASNGHPAPSESFANQVRSFSSWLGSTCPSSCSCLLPVASLLYRYRCHQWWHLSGIGQCGKVWRLDWWWHFCWNVRGSSRRLHCELRIRRDGGPRHDALHIRHVLVLLRVRGHKVRPSRHWTM